MGAVSIGLSPAGGLAVRSDEMDLYELLEAMAQLKREERAEAVAELDQLATQMVRDFECEGFSRREAIELTVALLTALLCGRPES
jgi:flagellar motor component MotA